MYLFFASPARMQGLQGQGLVILFTVVFLFPEQIVAQNTYFMYIYWLSG